MVLVTLVNELLCLNIRRKVIRDEVVVAVINDAVDKSGELFRVTKGALVNMIKDSGQLRIELVLGVKMCVAEILNVLCEVAEEENIVLSDLTSNFDLAMRQFSSCHHDEKVVYSRLHHRTFR